MGSHCVHNLYYNKMLLKLQVIVKTLDTFTVFVWFFTVIVIDFQYCKLWMLVVIEVCQRCFH
jgi:hypothetical protein